MTTIDRRAENEKLVLGAIREWFQHCTYGPCYRDLEGMIKADGHKISLGTTHSTCAALQDCGKITLVGNVARSIRLTKGK